MNGPTIRALHLQDKARALAMREGTSAAMAFVRRETMTIRNRQDRAVARVNAFEAIPEETGR